MKVKMYTLALPEEGEIKLEQHTFDTDNKEDIDAIGGYYPENGIEDGEELTEDDLEAVARSFLYNEEVLEWEQRMIRCIILSQSQLEALNKASGKYIAS